MVGRVSRMAGFGPGRWIAALALAAILALSAGGHSAQGAFPGENGRIAFVSNRDGNAEIYTSAPDGSDPRRLTSTLQAESSPSFSPDGTRIAFARAQDIWVMNADGSVATQLTGSEGSGEDSPAWSRDGTKLAFVSNRSTTGGGTTGPELWVMETDGSDVRRLTDTPASASLAPAWSPTADQIAFHSNLDGEFEVYTIDANATPGSGTDSRVKLTDNVGLSDQNPSWSPDGTRIVFERGTGTNLGDTTKELWAMDAAGTNQAQLTTDSDYDAEPVWSPDGARIAFESNADGDLEVFSMPAGGGTAVNLTNTTSGIDDREPDWGAPPPPPPPTPTPTPTPDGSPTPGGAPQPAPPPPIIFIHGFLGSRIGCGIVKGESRPFELWPNIALRAVGVGVTLTAPRFDQMRLGSDGVSNLQSGDGCTRSAGVTGLVESVLTADIYGGTVRNLNGLGRPYYVYTYDWRRSPELALAGLDALIERARSETGAAKVVLFAHSMGGLVTRWYIDDPARAAKVARALTVGTPYWGSAKSWLPLVRGLESQGFSRFNPLDVLVHDPEGMKRWARNLTGLYFLYPSAAWYREKGPWLSFEDEFGGRGLLFAGVLAAIHSQRGNVALARQAYAGHGNRLDGFKANGVDYRVVVGTSLETVTSMREHRRAWIPFTDYIYGDGDGTVPTFSGLQQRNAASPVFGEPIPRHFVCGLDHNALATDPGLFAGVAGFLRDGSEITLARASSDGQPDRRGLCGRSSSGGRGREIIIYGDGGRGPGLPDVEVEDDAAGAASAAARRSQAGGGAMKLHEAAQAGLIDVLERGERTVIVARGAHPTVLRVTGRKLAVQITPLLEDRKGRTVGYAARAGRLVLTGTSATLNGRRLRPSPRDRTPPRTTVKLRRAGARTVLTPKARDRSGIRATFIRIGRGKRRAWRGPLRVPTRKLKSVRFGSVDAFGNAEPQRRLQGR